MFWIIGLVFGVVLYFVVPDVPFLAALVMGPIIVGLSLFVSKLFGLDKDV